MKQLAAAFVLALVLAGSAGADVFRVVPNTSTAAVALPSAQIPNAPGTVSFSLAPPASPETLAYPQLLGLWQRAGAAYGIPWQVLAAINKIESNFGRNMGPSSAGAVGWMQFMPDTWRRWGVDADRNGVADPWNAADAIYAGARYLAASGARTDLRRAIFSYNHADWYVNEVLELASLYGQGGSDVVFTLDRLQLDVDEAQKQIVTANERLLVALRAARRQAGNERRLQDRAATSPLLSNALTLQRRAAQLTLRRLAAERAVSA